MATQIRALASCVVASACAASSPTATSSAPATSAVASSTAEPVSLTEAAPPPTPAPPTPPETASADASADEDHTPPEVLSALLQSDGVELHFSEPLAPVDGIDPSSFRLSMGLGERDDGDAYAYHIDVAEVAGLDGPLRIGSLALDNDGRALRLSFSEPLPPEFCETLAEERTNADETPNMEVGLFLHYAPQHNDPVQDHAGNALPAQGARWVTSRAATMETEFGSTDGGSVFDGLTEVRCSSDFGPASLAYQSKQLAMPMMAWGCQTQKYASSPHASRFMKPPSHSAS